MSTSTWQLQLSNDNATDASSFEIGLALFKVQGNGKHLELSLLCIQVSKKQWNVLLSLKIGAPHGPGPGPLTTPNFQNKIAPVNIKIYWRSGYEHRLVFFHQYTLITNLCS